MRKLRWFWLRVFAKINRWKFDNGVISDSERRLIAENRRLKSALAEANKSLKPLLLFASYRLNATHKGRLTFHKKDSTTRYVIRLDGTVYQYRHYVTTKEGNEKTAT